MYMHRLHSCTSVVEVLTVSMQTTLWYCVLRIHYTCMSVYIYSSEVPILKQEWGQDLDWKSKGYSSSIISAACITTCMSRGMVPKDQMRMILMHSKGITAYTNSHSQCRQLNAWFWCIYMYTYTYKFHLLKSLNNVDHTVHLHSSEVPILPETGVRAGFCGGFPAESGLAVA